MIKIRGIVWEKGERKLPFEAVKIKGVMNR